MNSQHYIRLVLAVAALSALPTQQALASHVSCGMVVTTDTRLDSDLRQCPGDGIVIGAGDIILDLNGHTISGTGGGTGIDDSAGHDGVRIANGTVTSFSHGVVLIGADDSRLARLTVSHNALGGISLVDGSDRNRVDHNVVSDNNLDGIFLFGSSDNRIEHNTVTGNDPAGISLVDGANGNRVKSNSVSDNALGIAVGLSHRNRIAHNTLSDNAVLGVVLDGSDETVLEKNSASGSELFGILVTGSAQTIVLKNTITRNGDDGILVDESSAATVIDRNRANDNGDFGIEAVSSVIDADGNRASGNGNPAQCLNVACS